MILRDKKNRKLEIRDSVWILAEDLFIKWGHSEEDIESAKTSELAIKDVDDVTPELSIWGIPWKWIEE